jgi:hypothetical protein
MDEKEEKAVKAGDDGFCLPKSYDGETHSIESLRCLCIAYFFLFEWVQWDLNLVSHGSHVAKVLGVVLIDDDELPLLDFGKLSLDIIQYHPRLENGDRVLALIHPSLLDRSLGMVSRL